MSKEEKEILEVEETQENKVDAVDEKDALLAKKRKAKKEAEEKAAQAALEAQAAAEAEAKKAAEKPKAKKSAPKKAAKKKEEPKEEVQEAAATVEEQPQEEAKPHRDETPQKRWYIVHTYSGHENKVKVNLEKRIEYMNMGEKIFRVEVPQKTITQVKGGKKSEKEEKIFPGYVLVEMIMDEDSWYVVRHTAGVTKFVGSSKKPIPAKDSEIKKIIHRGASTVQKIELDVKVGDKVRIISGPFAEFIGDISEVYPDKSKLRAMVSIFGRETPVELEYKQIQKV